MADKFIIKVKFFQKDQSLYDKEYYFRVVMPVNIGDILTSSSYQNPMVVTDMQPWKDTYTYINGKEVKLLTIKTKNENRLQEKDAVVGGDNKSRSGICYQRCKSTITRRHTRIGKILKF